MSRALRQVGYLEVWGAVAAGDEEVVVHDGHRVIDASAAALAEGVRPGMALGAARHASPGARLVRHDPAVAVRALEPLYRAAARLGPAVEPAPGQACFLDLTGLRDARDALADLLATLLPGFAPRGRAGLATSKLLARVAAQRAGEPDGPAGRGSPVLAVEPGGEGAFLASLPVAALWPLSDHLHKQLERLGFRTVADVARVPTEQWVRRFGPDGWRLARYARGEDPAPVAALYPPRRLVVRLAFPGGPPAPEGLRAALGGLAPQLAAELGAGAMGATGALTFGLRGGGREASRTLARPRQGAAALHHALGRCLEEILAGGPWETEELEAYCTDLRTAAAGQMDLWGTRETSRTLASVLEDLERRYPRQVVATATLLRPTWREAMLGFYDPWRRAAGGTPGAAGGAEAVTPS